MKSLAEKLVDGMNEWLKKKKRMSNSYLQFSANIADLTLEEFDWWNQFLHGLENPWDPYTGEPLPQYAELNEPEILEHLDFQWSFNAIRESGAPYTIEFFADENGDPRHVASVVQQFLKIFRVSDFFVLTYSVTCDRMLPGAFGGGALVVTAERILDRGAWGIIERARKSLKRRGYTETKTDD